MTTGEHAHHFCGYNTAGRLRCCKCNQPADDAGLSLKERCATIYRWVDANLFFINAASKEPDR